MGIADRISGRLKQAAGDLLGDRSTKREGAREERKADAEEEARAAEREAVAKREEAAKLERRS